MNIDTVALVDKFLKLLPLYDRIPIDTEAHARLMAWRDEHKELVREQRHAPLHEGVIDYKLDKGNGDTVRMLQYFRSPSEAEPEGLMIVFAHPRGGNPFPVLAFDFTVMADFGRIKVTGEWQHSPSTSAGDDPEDTPTQSAITVYCSLMAYMEHYKEVRERVGERNQMVTVKKKKPKHGQKKGRVVRAHRVEYRITPPTSEEIRKEAAENKERAKPSGTWGVRGHSRTYKKSGRTIWITPYEKGEGRRSPTTYKV